MPGGRYAWVIILGLLALAVQVPTSRAETPTSRVKAILEEAMAVQTDRQLQGPEFRKQRRVAIKKIIADNFDFPSMARQALGPSWEKLSDSDRSEFRVIFQDLFQDSYTKLVLDFLSREKVLYSGEEIRNGKAKVQTTLVRPNEEIPVDYSLAQGEGKWAVEDVLIDGVSIVRNYQRSFAQVIQRESFKSLLQKMRLQQQAIAKSP